MKHYLSLLCFALTSFFFMDRAAASLLLKQNPTPLESDLPSVSGKSYQLAKVTWLPDYLKDNKSYGNNRTNAGGRDKGGAKNCSAYGLLATCPIHQAGRGVSHPIAGLTCYKECVCDVSYYKYNSANCKAPKILGEDTCKDISSSSAMASTCLCPSEYNLSACPEGAACEKCDSKYKQTGCDKGYILESGKCVKEENCDDYTLTVCPDGGICSACPDNGSKLKLDHCDGTKGWAMYVGWTDDGSATCEPIACPAGYTAGVTTCDSADTSLSCSKWSGGKQCCFCKKTEPTCAAEYQYTVENCPPETSELCGLQCGDKYTKCWSRPYPQIHTSPATTFNYGGLTFTNKKISISSIPANYGDKWVLDCPYAERDFDFYKLSGAVYYTSKLPNYLYSCYSGERECIDIFLKLYKEGEVSLDKDLQCGNLSFDFSSRTGVKKYTLNGNGHTITFDKPSGNDFNARGEAPLDINNIKIVHNNSHPVSTGLCEDKSQNYVFEHYVNVTNAEIFADAGLAYSNVNFYGKNSFTAGKNIVTNPDSYLKNDGLQSAHRYAIVNDVNLWGSLDIILPNDDDFPQTDLFFNAIGSDAILNYKGASTVSFRDIQGNAKVNLCFHTRSHNRISIYGSSAPAENIRANLNFPRPGTDELGTYTPDICSESIFSGDFWK